MALLNTDFEQLLEIEAERRGAPEALHCCIEAKGVVAMHRSREADPSRTTENRNKPDIRRPAVWLLDGQVDQVGWADRLKQSLKAIA